MILARLSPTRLFLLCASSVGILTTFGCSESAAPATEIRLVIAGHPSQLFVGDTFRLSATAVDRNGSPVAESVYTWNSSAPATLVVSSTGLLHAMGPGSAVITVAAAGAHDTASLSVTDVYVQLSQSEDHTCATSVTGEGFCRGSGGSGELGNGGTMGSADFVPVAGGHVFSGVFPGMYYTCGLDTDSLAFCWGFGGIGNLGTGDTVNQSVPVPVAGGLRYARISTGDQTSCGITGTGATYCWGWGIYGQNGNPAGPGNLLTPSLVANGPPLVSISTSSYTGCGTTAAHAAFCWGFNRSGQLGHITDTVFNTPVPLAGGHTFQSLSMLDLECGVATDQTVYCWGPGNSAPGYGPYLTPQALAGSLHFTRVSASFQHACGLSADSTAYCWGWDLSPQSISSTLKFTALGAGGYYDCAVATDSTTYCWAFHCGEALDLTCSQPPTPTAVLGGRRFVDVTSGDDAPPASCGTSADSTVACWRNDRPSVPGEVPGMKLHSVTIGFYTLVPYSNGGPYACGIGADSLGYCWNFSGSDTIVATAPVALPGGLKYSALSVSLGHLCGISDGSVYCWDTSTPNPVPVPVPGSSGFVTLVTGYRTNCGLKTDGSIACWGLNSFGELGIGFASEWSPTPLPVSGGLAFIAVETAGDHTCGVTTDSTTYCWGAGQEGMLGTGTTDTGPTPRPVNTSLKFGSLALGWGLSCGLTGDGAAYCWGRGASTPAAQQPGTRFKSLSARGYSGMCGLTVDGHPLCWNMPAYVKSRSGTDPLRIRAKPPRP